MRARLVVAVSAVVVVGLLAWWLVRARRAVVPPVSTESSPVAVFSTGGAPEAANASASAPTAIYAHNLMLRKGSTGFRVYVRWLRGQMARTSRNVNPSFDEPDSFVLDVTNGVVHTNVGDLANFLNDSVTNSPLKNIKLTGDGDQLKVSGTFRRILPIEAIATIGVAPDNRIQMHVTKINVLKLPFKKLLGGLNVTVSSLFHPKDIPGVEVKDNDVFLDTAKAVPPPHIRGQLTSIRIINPDIRADLWQRPGGCNTRGAMAQFSAAAGRHHRFREAHHAARRSDHGRSFEQCVV